MMNVLNGIDVLVKNGFEHLKGHRIGLITNHTGLSRDLKPTVDILHEHSSIELATLFGPEHGIRGELDEVVPDSKDEKTGLPVYSLYGKHKKPTSEMLQNLDMLVYDIQDIGCRFYTYISTLGLAIESAAEANLPIVVLDRINPINGVDVEGALADEDRYSFTAYYKLPVRHGMTVGELAQYFNAEKSLNATLVVVKCEGWKRADWFDTTGLYWVHPSPNMRSLTQATLYPGIGLLETTNLSVGRGTDTPFEHFGAPWMDGRKVSEALNQKKLRGIRFYPVRFTPRFREFKGEVCDGVSMVLTDREQFKGLLTGLEIATTLHKLYSDTWTVDKYMNLLVNRKAMDALKAGKSAKEIESEWKEDLTQFVKTREKYLIYE